MAQKRKDGRTGSSDNRYTKPNDVHDTLESLGKNYNQLYDAILRNAILRWDLDADDVWAQALFRADKAQMMRWAGLSKHTFYDKWRKISEAGLIREEPDGVFVVTKLIRKQDLGIVPSEFKRMQQENADMRDEIAEMREQVGEVEQLREELRGLMLIVQGLLKTGQNAPEERPGEVQKLDRSVQKLHRSVQKLHPPHPFKGLKNKKDSDKEEEASSVNSHAESSELIPGSMPWIEVQIANLWPGRGVRHPEDDEYLAELAKFLPPALEEAFEAARESAKHGEGLKYGTYTWLLNRLRNPKHFVQGGRKKRERKGKDEERPDDIGTLVWDEDDEGGEEQ